MGYNSPDAFVYLLEGGDVVVDSSGNPVQVATRGPWTSAWPDSIKLRFASEGISQLIRTTQMDPSGVNYVDFMRPVYADRITFPDHFKEATGATLTQSGARALHIRNVSAATDIDLRGPVFRVTAGQTYRFSIHWKSTTATASQLSAGIDSYDQDFTYVGGAFFTPVLAGTNGAWQWDSIVWTCESTARFGVARVLDQPGTDSELYIDEILIEPVGGLVRRTTNAGQSIETGAGEIVVFEDATTTNDTSDVTYSAGTFTVVRPGDYNISAAIAFNDLADTIRCIVVIRRNATQIAGGNLAVASTGTTTASGSAVSITERFARGDTLDVFVQHSAAGTETLVADGLYNWVTIKRVD